MLIAGNKKDSKNNQPPQQGSTITIKAQTLLISGIAIATPGGTGHRPEIFAAGKNLRPVCGNSISK
jgi:hypothetical protein